MKRILSIGMTVGLLATLAACSESEPDVAPDTATTQAAPLTAIPGDAEVVSGTATCDVLVDEGVEADGTPGSPVYVCELYMTDPRVSGTQRDDRWRIVVEGAAWFAWVYEESVITNEEGTWRGAIQAADDGVPCGEAHYVGEAAYEGLEFHYYFCDVGDAPVFRGWITAGG